MPPRHSTEDHPATWAAFFERERAAWARYATYAHYGEHIGDLAEFRRQLAG